MNKTKVYLIGAGPGDPELITRKACRVLEMTDVVLYDYLVHPNIILMAKQAKKICVGKKKGAHSTKQPTINEMLIKYAKEGKVVARLKGGDPMIFGRCGEEMAALSAAGISYEIIPGITSAISAPTYAGIPITHRDCSHSVAFVTATRANDIENMTFPNADTLVMMMSLLRLSSIITRLKTLRDVATPVAIIESGTYASEKVLVGTIATIESLQETHQLKPPALIVVGEVVNLRYKFNWRDHLPLRHRRFVICRPNHQQSALADKLSVWGAEVLTLSLNRITPDPQHLKTVDLASVTMVIFTSENGVYAFFSGLLAMQKDIRVCASAKVLAIGSQTKKALQAYGITPDIMPEIATSEGIVATLDSILTPSDYVIIPTSSEADDTLIDLKHTGAKVSKLVSYTNHVPEHIGAMLDWIEPSDTFIFMNAASVNRLHVHYHQINAHKAVSIGPKTTAQLHACGVSNVVEADDASIDGIVNTILQTPPLNCKD